MSKIKPRAQNTSIALFRYIEEEYSLNKNGQLDMLHKLMQKKTGSMKKEFHFLKKQNKFTEIQE